MGFLARPVLIVLLCFGVVLGILAMTAPWGFFMGGHFHWTMRWQGVGVLHAKDSGGDYALYVRLWAIPASRHVTGSGVLCTPRRETFNLDVSGAFDKGIWLDTNGKKTELSLVNRTAGCPPCSKNLGINLDLRGQWKNPELVMDDEGSLSNYFHPDASLVTGGGVRPSSRGVATITLHEGTREEFEAACKTARR